MQYCNVHLKIAAPNSPSTGTMNGDIVFTPDNERGSVWSEGDTITPSASVRCELSNGVLMYNGNSKVQLMAGGGGVNPEKVYWRVAFENITLGEEQVQIDPFVFEAIPGETIDLAQVTPVMGYTPPGVIRGATGLKFLGVVDSASDLPTSPNRGDAYVNITNKSLFVWNGSKWEEIEDFASVDGNVETFSTVLTRAIDAAERAEIAAEETIQQVEGDFATRNYVDALKPDVDRGNYGRILSTSDVVLYDSIPPGNYTALSPFLRGIGLPGDAASGVFTRTLTNYAQSGTSILDTATWILGGKKYEYYRGKSSAGWNAWVESSKDPLEAERERSIPNEADWDTFTTPGQYRRISTLHTGENMPDTNVLGVLEVFNPGHSSGLVAQMFYGTSTGGVWYRALTTNRWLPWIRLDTSPKPDVQRATIVELGKRRRGGVVGTGGLPAVALRFDHHLDSFATKVLPLLKQYNLPWMQAINPGRLGTGDDNWTAAKLATECHISGGEVYNHSLTHSSFTNDAGADQQISGSLTQLKAALSSLHIDGWAAYGTHPQLDHEAGISDKDFYDTYPGQLIVNQHAFVRSYLPGSHERLAGPQMIGGNHSTIDRDTTGAARRGLDAAMERGMGITFMLHPNYLDQEGYMSTSQFETLLAYIATKRDAGELRVLSCTGIMLADKARSDDFNLLSTLAQPDATGTENVNSRSYLLTLGVPHEAQVWVKGTGQVTLKVEVDSPTYPVTSQHQVTLGGNAQRLSTLITPPNDTTGIEVSLTGDVQHTGVKYRPI